MGPRKSSGFWKRDTSSFTSATFMAPFLPSLNVKDSFSTFLPNAVVRKNSGSHDSWKKGTHEIRKVWKSSKYSTARTSVFGCVQLTTTSLRMRYEYRCAKIHPSAPPQSCGTSN